MCLPMVKYNPPTWSGSVAASATMSTMMFPTATVNSQPACSTDFMLLGAWRAKRHSNRATIITKYERCQFYSHKHKITKKNTRIQCQLQLFSEQQCCQMCNESPLYLWVGELQASHREDHLSCSHEEILRNLPGHVDGVRLDVHHLPDALSTLEDKNPDVKP